MREEDPFKHLFEDESYKRAMKKATPDKESLVHNQKAQDHKKLQELSGGTLNFNVATSSQWSMTKCVDYINALCIQNGVRNWNTTVASSRATLELKKLLAAIIPKYYASRVEAIKAIQWIIENWVNFEKSYPRAAEIGFSIPYWAKAWDKIKKFQELSTQANEKELYLDRPLYDLDNFLK